jgi:hypothetical protein
MPRHTCVRVDSMRTFRRQVLAPNSAIACDQMGVLPAVDTRSGGNLPSSCSNSIFHMEVREIDPERACYVGSTMRWIALLLVVVAGCEKTAPAPAAKTEPDQALSPPTTPPAVAPVTTTAPPKQATRIELTAVTLADDCGGTPPWRAPMKTAKSEEASQPEEPREMKAKSKADSAHSSDSQRGARARMRCEQTSMQLAIIAGDASNIQVKSVELFDDKGTSLGTLTASKPTRWSDTSSTYEAWDETFAAGTTSSVSYVLTQPKWDAIGDRWNKTYTLKTVVSVGGVEQAAERSVTLTAPTSLPPNVKT